MLFHSACKVLLPLIVASTSAPFRRAPVGSCSSSSLDSQEYSTMLTPGLLLWRRWQRTQHTTKYLDKETFLKFLLRTSHNFGCVFAPGCLLSHVSSARLGAKYISTLFYACLQLADADFR